MLKEALLEERVRRGFNKETERPRVEALVESVVLDCDSLEDLVKFLNNTQGQKTVRGESVVNND